MHPLQPIDGDMARRFLDLLDPDHDAFLFAAGDDNQARAKASLKAGKRPWIDHRHGSIDDQLKWLGEQQAKGWGIFTTVQRMKGKRRLAANVAIIRAVFHEWDTAAPPPTFELPPSLIVETSTSADTNGEVFPRLHHYWFIIDPEHPISAEDFHGMMECMVEAHGSDPDAKDLARVLRLPGTWHQKGEPHQVRIVGGCEARYTRDELIKAFPPPVRHKPDPKAPRPTLNGHAPPGLERFSAPLKAIPAVDYGTTIRVGQALHHEGGGSSAALAQWDAWCATCADKWAPGWCEDKWATFRGNGVSGGTIFALAEQHGYTKPAKASKEQPKAQHLNGSAHAPLEASAPPRTKGKGNRIDGLEFDDEITISTKVDALVKGVLHRGQIGIVYGPSGAGKTFAVLNLGYHLAHGRDWYGHRVKQAPVLYVGLEGQGLLKNRVKAAAQQLGSTPFFARMTVTVVLNKSEAGNAGEAAIIDKAKRLEEATGQPVGLIVIDTMARAMAGDDENSAQDVSALNARLARIAEATGAAVLVVHHTGKDDTRGPRGSSSLFAYCDVTLKVTRNEAIREIYAEKVRDGEERTLLSYRIKKVTLEVDEDGDEITSCIVEAVNAGERTAPPRPSGQAGRAMDELHEFLIGRRCRPAKNHPRARDGAMLVRKDAWRDACLKKHLTADGDPESERKAFQRAHGTLLKDGLIGDYGGDVWLIAGTSVGHGHFPHDWTYGTSVGHAAEDAE